MHGNDELTTRINKLEETLQESITTSKKNQESLQKSLQESLQEIIKQNAQHFCELKNMSSRCLIDNGGHDGKHAPACEDARNMSPFKNRVHPSPNKSGPGSRVHPEPNTSGATFAKAAKGVLDEISASSQIAGLKHARPQPKTLDDQYDSELEQLYLQEWPDALPEYKNDHECCCRRDAERDRDSREMLEKLFPPYVHCLLVFSGAIPPRRKACFYFVTVFWILFTLLLGLGFLFSVAFVMGLLLCRLEANCQTSSTLSYRQADVSVLAAVALMNIPTLLSVILVHTYVRDQLQSRELRTLIASASVDRIRKPEEFWIGSFVFFCVFAPLYAVIQFSQQAYIQGVLGPVETIGFTAQLLLDAVPQFAIIMYFFVVSRAMSLSYDDWTTKMIGAVITTSPERSVEINLLQRLKARVALCALVTRNTRVMLVPSLVAVGCFLFTVFTALVAQDEKLATTVIYLFYSTVIRIIPLVFPFAVSWRMGILENVVAQASLRKISKYLEYAPTEWMLGQKASLSLNLLAKAGVFGTIFMGVCTVYVNDTKKGLHYPWDITYQHFGTCTDGVHSGLEQHIDCGGPDSSCPQTCREKYGEYILIPANRECADVDGYVHITTQRACAAAYNSWSRLHNRSSAIASAIVYGGTYSDNRSWGHGLWSHDNFTDGFRCGAHSMPRFVGFDVLRYSFPALFSSGKASYQKDHKRKPPSLFPPSLAHAYLCYAGDRSCEARGYDRGNTQFEEMMACPGFGVRSKWLASAWRNISGPLPTLAQRGDNVASFQAGRGSNGDCAEIRVHNSARTGAQVVFTLDCNASAHVDSSARGETGIGMACPKDNRIKVSVVQSGPVTRGALLVAPTTNMTNSTVYQLGSKSQHIIASPDNTFVLVVDQSSDSMTVTLCF